MVDHHETKTVCPHCGYRHDTATATYGNDQAPVDGNLSLCIDCGEWSVFEEGSLRKPTDDEYLDFGMNPEIQMVRRLWVEFDQQRRREKAC